MMTSKDVLKASWKATLSRISNQRLDRMGHPTPEAKKKCFLNHAIEKDLEGLVESHPASNLDSAPGPDGKPQT